jgi:hypothetical protein
MFVPCPLTCPICNQQNEYDWHVLFGCSDSMAAWHNVGVEETVLRCTHGQHTAKEAVMNICSNEYERVSGLFAMVCRTLWNNRNNCVWNGEKGRRP